MSFRICSRSVPLLCLVAAACGADVRRIDVCGRGDRAELAAALVGGRLEIEVLDDDGDVRSRATLPAAGARVEVDFDGGRRVRVIGRSAAGAEVAGGDAPVTAAGACVCLALAGQVGACAGLTCRVAGDTCEFLDAASGAPAGSRELAIGAADTTLVAAAPALAHGDGASVRAEAAAQLGLLRFATERLPRTSVIEEAWLELTLLPPPAEPFGIPVRVQPVLEAWDEATATWNERSTGVPWSAPGCGAGSCDPVAWAALDPDRAAERYLVPLGTRVAGWVVDPATNHGVALVGAGGTASFWSREGTGTGAAPPRLIVRYHMADDDLPPPGGGAICGNGLLEADEGCDDGDRDDTDACTNACAPARCGDGVTRTGVEDCDDGNLENADGCSLRCLRCADPNAGAVHVGDDGRCYARYDTPRSYTVAENACDEAGHGTLAVFETQAEENAVLAALGGPTALAWIGLSDRGTEGAFVWATGAAPGFQSFGAGEPAALPAANNEDCVAAQAGAWADRSCSESHAYVCEKQGFTVTPDGRAYLAVIGPTIDWDAARLECVALGAHLAAPTTAEEDALIDGLAGLQVWIGLGERGGEDALTWVTGEPFEYSGFAAAPGLGGDSFCTQVEGGGAWSIAPCAARRRYVCEAE